MKRNIVLIGLPGSGKTTVGQLVAKQKNWEFLDTDTMVEQRAGCSVSELFARAGESAFRDLESACVKTAAQSVQTVIATGGGAILRPENMAALKETGKVYFLDRPAADIAAYVDPSMRPLLNNDGEKIFRLEKERRRLYEKYADARFSGGTPAELAETIQTMYDLTECEE